MIAAFDMGIRNFAFAVKSNGDFILLKNTTLDENIMTKTDLNKYKKQELEEMMLNLSLNTEKNIKTTKSGMVDLLLKHHKKTTKLKDNKDLGIELFKIMDTYKHIWIDCDVFLIERQMAMNMQALKLSHYLEAYLKIYYPNKQVLNYNAATKTKKLGASNLKTKKDRKDWAVQYTSQLLSRDNLRYFESLKKKDDVADVVCMIETYQLSNQCKKQ